MNWRDRITFDPDVLMGKPTIRNTRISVELILSWLANGWTNDDLLSAYPNITQDDIFATLAYTADTLRDRV